MIVLVTIHCYRVHGITLLGEVIPLGFAGNNMSLQANFYGAFRTAVGSRNEQQGILKGLVVDS
jgi:hypothetical protein